MPGLPNITLRRRLVLASMLLSVPFAASLSGLACGSESGARIESIELDSRTAVTAETQPPVALSRQAMVEQGLAELLGYYSLDRQFAHIEELASDSYQGRKTGSPGSRAAASYISGRFSEMGLVPWSELGLSSLEQPFSGGGLNDDNVIGVLRGTEGGGAFVILAAHYDHLGIGASGAVFNGADDNAAGVAALLEAAAMMVDSGLRPARDIVFCAFSGEEQGQYGSQALGELISAHGYAAAVAMINIDGIGATGGSYFGVWDEGAANAAPLVAALSRAGAVLGETVVEEGTDIGSDAQPFNWQFGIPAVTVDWHWGQDETAFHPYYHTADDDTDHISRDALSRATRIAIAGLWLRAGDVP